MRRAVRVSSPVTLLELRDRIVVAVGRAVNRDSLFKPEERIKLWHDSLYGWGEGQVEVVAARGETEVWLARDRRRDRGR